MDTVKTVEERVADLEQKVVALREESAEYVTADELQENFTAFKKEIIAESAHIVAEGTKNLVKGFFGHLIKAPVAAVGFIKSKLARKPAAKRTVLDPDEIVGPQAV